ncbi:hypothetical protein BOTBODRAFT_179885 [Botryobasidium botryosum FD-172 SS1]|uniref:MPN domain-containing protein n=1 Tax=Botryobasidium botryosum (strain FD-172 SS1) TaxID=930990 RepID=A0A067M9X9_BOTB1|nr:hypothetical protein BOTBODRAFT_179885 [Botryobasidium botryosum FD-172 SS1]
MPASYQLSNLAYLKLYLHAAKFPHAPANGVLLGSLTSPDQVLISDAIPLLHEWTSLSPMMEIGLDLARGHAEGSGLTLVGYYQASEQSDNDTSLYPVGERVANIVREGFSDAIALVIDAKKIGEPGDPALVVRIVPHSDPARMPTDVPPFLQPFLPTTSDPKVWRPTPPVARDSSPARLVDPSSPARALASVRDDSLHQQLYDFDEHLEDVKLDWLRNRDVETYLQNKS